MSDENRNQTHRRPGTFKTARWGLAAVALLGVVTLGISCQDKSTSSTGASGDKTPVAATSLKVPEGPATQPVGVDKNGRPVASWVRALGFTFAAAPVSDRERGIDERQSAEEIKAANATCVACHTNYRPTDNPSSEPWAIDTDSMHAKSQGISCVDCHGGVINVAGLPTDPSPTDPNYKRWKNTAHVQPTHPEFWPKDSASNPELRGAETNVESADYFRFINPGGMRGATVACAPCHHDEVHKVHSSMMAHGGMLWGAALYNNGAINRKNPVYGEFYGPSSGNPSVSVPTAMIADPLPTVQQSDRYGVLSALYPLPRWEITLPGNVLRVFERGGKEKGDIGLPQKKEDTGRPDVKLSTRGFGTELRTDPVFIGLQKTRLFGPTINFMGTNDHPGDYRAGGCSACHVIYANDRSPVSSSFWGRFGNRGQSFSADPTVNKPDTATGKSGTQPFSNPWTETSDRPRGQPVKHVMVKQMPSSTCINCHIHPGTNVMMSYLGVLWWDNETDGKHMFPSDQKYPTGEKEWEISQKNPEGSAVRGLWSDTYPNSTDHNGVKAGPDFLEKLGTPEFNAKLTRTQFADFHSHGWVFRAVYKQDKKGNLLDHSGAIVTANSGEELSKKLAEGMNFQNAEKGTHAADGVPVHLKDIHLERGMQCVDCHFKDDAHGTGHLWGETRNAVSIDCVDCHGGIEGPSNIQRWLTLKPAERNKAAGKELLSQAFTGNASRAIDRDRLLARNADLINKHFQLKAGKLFQKSTMYQEAQSKGVDVSGDKATPPGWNVSQTVETPVLAHTVRKFDPKAENAKFTWGGAPGEAGTGTKSGGMELAHGSKTMSCYTCHTSWNTSCFGCHLPQKANQYKSMLHNEGIVTRNYTNYNYQTLRDDVFMIGVDSTARDHKVSPIRSACAVLVSSQNANREWIYTQQQTLSAEGYSGQAFSPYFPHTVRARETKNCVDCHIHKDDNGNVDNNATMAQLLLQGTNAFNFIGRFAFVAEEDHGFEAVVVTERDEPQAVIGSTLHQLAYPDWYKDHLKDGRKLKTAHNHHGHVLDLQHRGEYLYAACGKDGFIAYDIANLDNKGFSERIVTAPVSPLGQRFYIKSKYATSIGSPSTLALDPTRTAYTEEQRLTDGSVRQVRPNEEGKITPIGQPNKVIDQRNIHLFYAFLYLTDLEEGLIVIGNPVGEVKNKAGVATLLDGDPENNFLERAVTFNPGGALKGARKIDFYGHYAYISCDSGLVVVDLDNPLEPKIVNSGVAGVNGPRRVAFQFRYAFVCDDDGVKVLDITDPANPKLARDKDGKAVVVPLADAKDIYVARTYGFVAAGKDGVVILDLEKPEAPVRLSNDDLGGDYNAEWKINDAHAVRFGMTNASMFLYVADGKNGLKVLQLTSPEYTPTYLGFSPKLTPKLVSWYPTHGPAIALSEGLDRDRAVDESGHQLTVFGRKGARPFTKEESERLYLRVKPDGTKEVWGTDLPSTKLPAPAATPAPGTGTETPAPGTGTPGRPRPRPGSSSGGGATETPAPAPEPTPAPAPSGVRRPGRPPTGG